MDILTDLKPNDRLLLLSIPDPAVVERLAKRLTEGILVGLGSDETVSAARATARDLENVMFLAAGPDDIPWRDAFFTKAIAFGAERGSDVARVLVPGGVVLEL